MKLSRKNIINIVESYDTENLDGFTVSEACDLCRELTIDLDSFFELLPMTSRELIYHKDIVSTLVKLIGDEL